jgi:hypothetical protein
MFGILVSLVNYTPLATVVSRAVNVSTLSTITAPNDANLAVSWKEGAVIGAVITFIGVITEIRHSNKCIGIQTIISICLSK